VGATNEDLGMPPGLRVDNGRRRGMDPLLKLLHSNLDGLVPQVLEKLVLTDAATAAAELRDRIRPAI